MGNTLKTFMSPVYRNKLLFTSKEIENVKFTDIGELLSEAIEPDLQNRHLPMIADDALDKIIREHTVNDKETGDYVAIKNIGILFEPALHFSLQVKFDSWAKNRWLIVYKEGEIKDKTFYLSNSHDAKYSINLSTITYNII
jgi:hypothetical protein